MTRLITLFALFAATASLVSAQITLTADNATPPPGYVDSLYLGSTAGLIAPSTGPAQVWDYSHIQDGSLRVVDLLDVSGNTFLPTARTSSPGSLRFQVFAAEADFYEGADEEGLFEVGRVVTETPHSLALVTGNPNDELSFVADTNAYEGRIDILQFPLSYPDSYGGARIERTNVLLTVAAFGLNEVPVQAKRDYSETREVVGYGELIIPLEDQSPSAPIDVLLMRVERFATDSFFLAGNPAPAALMAAFGVFQGMTASDQYYVFYTADFHSPVLVMDVDEADHVLTATYRPAAAELVSSTRDVALIGLSVYPNPCPTDQPLVITTDEAIPEGFIQLYDQQGRLLAQRSSADGGTTRHEFHLPTHLSAGAYLVRLRDKWGRSLATRQIMVP